MELIRIQITNDKDNFLYIETIRAEDLDGWEEESKDFGNKLEITDILY